MAILLLNVGSTDLQVRGTLRDTGKPINVSASGRSAAQAILDGYEGRSFVDAYDGNVLEPDVVGWPLVSKYLQWFRDRRRRLDRVVIFGTDQPETVGIHQDGDTVIGAQVLARLVADHGADVVDSGGVQAATLDVDGADRHDRCLKRFQELLPKVAAAGSVHVAVTGGTPAANLGLLLAAQAIWGDRVEALAARPKGPAFPLDVARQVRVAFQRQPVVDLLCRGQFATAAGIVESWGEPRLHSVARAATALRHWLDLAHDDAFRIVAEASDDASRVGSAAVDAVLHDLTNDLRHRVQFGTHPSHVATLQVLVDVYWNADLCLQQERYVDFVARMALIVERASRAFVENLVGAKVPDDQRNDEAGVTAFWAAVEALDAVHTYGRHIDVSTYRELALNLPGNNGTVLSRVIDALQGLRTIRNRSIIGHDLSPVTPERIATSVNPGLAGQYKDQPGKDVSGHRGVPGVCAAVRELLRYVGHEPTGPNPFLTYGERLARALLDVPL